MGALMDTRGIIQQLALMIFLIAAVWFVLFALAGDMAEVEGKTITVDDSGGQDYEKIQDAVNAAEEGDIIRVFEGAYAENVILDQRLSLEGNSSLNTIIDGSNSGNVITVNADGCTIR